MDYLLWQTCLSSIAGKKAHSHNTRQQTVSMSFLNQFKEQKLLELGKLEHQVSVVLLSNPEAATKINSLQGEIKKGLEEFEVAGSAEAVSEVLYAKIGNKILSLKVLLGGNELSETIE